MRRGRQPDRGPRRAPARLLGVVLVVGLGAGCGGAGRRTAVGTPAPTSAASGPPPASAPTTDTATTTAPVPTSGSTPATTTCDATAVVQQWPLARKAAQLIVVPSLNFDLAALTPTLATGVGGVLFLGNARTPSNLAGLVGAADRAVPGGVPPMVMADEEGGGVQRLSGLVTSIPWARQMAQSMTVDQVRSTAATVAGQMRVAGVGMDLAPVLDVDGRPGPSNSNPDGLRSFSADPAMTSRYGVAFMDGLRQGGIVPVVKHFPGLGGSTGNTDNGPASTLPLATLQTGGLVPFRAAIAAGAPAVMMSNAIVPGLTSGPASLSSAAVAGLLRHDLGFGGLVLTDSLSAGAIAQTGDTLPQAAVAAIAAGGDMVLFGSTLNTAQTLLLSPTNVDTSTRQIIAALVAAVGTGTLPVGRLDDAVMHVLTAKAVNGCATG